MTHQPRLARYLEATGLAAPPEIAPAGLCALQAAHRQAIGFGNLDIRLGRKVSIDPDTVFAKLVARRRGGYCFEHNRLFADMLTEAGFACRMLLARVLLGDPAQVPARLHCLVLVSIDGAEWIADAGFGGAYAPPMPLADGALATSGDGAHHRLRRIGLPGGLPGEWLLEREAPAGAGDERVTPGRWQAQYAFDTAEVAEADCALANFWCYAHPQARFATMHVVSRCLPDGFASLIERELTVQRAGQPLERRTLATPADYHAALGELFALEFAPEEITRLPLFAG